MSDDRLHFAGFDVAFRGRSVDVIVLPRAATDAPPTLDAILTALRRTPLERPPRELIARALDAAADPEAEIRIPVGQVQTTTDDPAVPCAVVIAGDALAAYVVPTAGIRPAAANVATLPDRPPAPAGASIEDAPGDADADREAAADEAAASPPCIVSTEQLRRLLSDANVTAGILEDTVAAFGTGANLRRITCVALGRAATPGTDAALQFHFERDPRLAPRQREDGSVDFHSMLIERFVEPGAVLVTRTPAVEPQEGQSVLGVRLVAPPVRDLAIATLAGEHTEVRGDELVAALGGRPIVNAAGRIDVVPVYEVAGNLDYGVGNIDFPGDVIVRGDVRPGFAISAAGAVVVQGLVEGATITAGRDLTVMGVVGEHWSVFTVGGDLTAQYLHTTEATVAGAIHVTREIVNCRIQGERLTMASTGHVIGGEVTAHTEVSTGSIGAANGTFTEVSVLSRDANAVVRAHHAAHPGAVIRVGGARREITDELAATSFWDVAGTLLTLRAGANEREVLEAQEAQRAAKDAQGAA